MEPACVTKLSMPHAAAVLVSMRRCCAKQVSSLEAKLCTAQQQSTQAASALEQCQNKLSRTELLHKQHIVSMADLDQQLCAERETSWSQKQLIEQLQDQISAAKDEKFQHHERIAALQDQLTTSVQSLQSIKDIAQEQQTKLAAAKSQHDDAITELEAQLSSQASLHKSTQIEQLQEELDASHAQSFQHAACIAELTSQLRQLQSKLIASNAQSLQDAACIADLHSQLDESKLAIEHAESAQDAKCIAALKSQLQRVESKLATGNAQAVQDANVITVLKSHLADATQAVFCQKELLQQQSANISSMQQVMAHAAVASQQEQAEALETIALMQHELSTFEADAQQQMLALRQHNALTGLQQPHQLDLRPLDAMQLMSQNKALGSNDSPETPQQAAMSAAEQLQIRKLQLFKQNLLQGFQSAMPDKKRSDNLGSASKQWPSKLQLMQQQ